MTDPAKVTALLVDAATLDDDVDTVAQTAADGWAVRFEAVDIEVGLDTERDRIILVATIGVPVAERRLSTLETLMAYNFLVRETGGVRLAMTGTDGDVVQMVDIAIEGLTPRTLAVVLANMKEKTLVWRAFFANDNAGTATVPNIGHDAIRFNI
jgi:hypothetical protein